MIKKILAATDFSDSSRVALQRAEQLARSCEAELILLHVRNEFVPDGVGFVPIDLWAEEEAIVAAALERVLSELRARGTAVRAVQVLGVPQLEIAREVEREKVDLVVMGTHGRHGLGRLVLGSVAEQVMRTSKVPVMVLRSLGTQAASDLPVEPASLPFQALEAFQTILVPVDLHAPSLTAVQYAFEVAERTGAKVHLLYACPEVSSGTNWLGAKPFDSPRQQALDKLHCLALAHHGSPTLGGSVAIVGEPSQVILDTALELGADLMVMGTDARGGVARFLKGSVTAEIGRAARCAVVVVNSGSRPSRHAIPEASRVATVETR